MFLVFSFGCFGLRRVLCLLFFVCCGCLIDVCWIGVLVWVDVGWVVLFRCWLFCVVVLVGLIVFALLIVSLAVCCCYGVRLYRFIVASCCFCLVTNSVVRFFY